MSEQQNNQVMAFAALCQCAEMVKNIARQNRTDDGQLKVMLNSLTMVDAQSPVAIYQDLDNLQLGYRTVVNQLGNAKEKDIEVTRYIMGMIALERALASRPKALAQLSERIEDLNRLLTHFDLLDENTISTIATIYTDVISPLGRRIQIAGQEQFLRQEANQNKVRALLLCGIRAAVLWRQVGGKRRHLIFSRSAVLEVAQRYCN